MQKWGDPVTEFKTPKQDEEDIVANEIVHRQPREGRLSILQGTSLRTRSETRCAFLAGFPNTSVGVFATLPLHNGVFQENTVEASFDDSGQLESLKFKEEAQAEKASSAFSDVSESLAKLPKVVDGARKEAAEAKTTAVDTQF